MSNNQNQNQNNSQNQNNNQYGNKKNQQSQNKNNQQGQNKATKTARTNFLRSKAIPALPKEDLVWLFLFGIIIKPVLRPARKGALPNSFSHFAANFSKPAQIP